MSDLLTKDDASSVTFTVDNVSKAKLCLENMFDNQEIIINEDSVEIIIDSD